MTKREATQQADKIVALRELIKIQCRSGNWNYDPYNFGLANGMILALSVFTNEEPDFMSAPSHWLREKTKV